MFYSTVLFSFILIIIILFILLIIEIINKKRYPYCGGFLNVKEIPKCKADDCTNKEKESDFSINLAIVIELLLEIFKNTPETFLNFTKSLFPEAKIYKGIFYFAPPELLKILPSDFGQNNSTPYGIISFFNTYISCITDIEEYCHQNLKDNKRIEILCNFLRILKKKQDCPFIVNDSNTNLYIPDKKFFNNIGLLGAFSIDYTQAILLKIRLPIKNLNLNYWSLNVYVADNLDPNLICHPYLNLNVASIVPPLNMYTGVGISNKKFNPITGEGDLLEEGFVNFLVIISINQTIGNVLEPKYIGKYDFVHIFKIPTADGSMPLDPNLPNPNNLNSNSKLFNPVNQRLTLFMRISPDPHKTDLTFFKTFINDKTGEYFQVLLINFDKDKYPIVQYSRISLPRMINASVNEFKDLNAFKDIKSTIQNNLFLKYRVKKLELRNSTLNIFGPQFKNVFNTTTKNYQGGWQGIQLGGNAQGDNYDAQYRLSQSVCLNKKDVMISVCVNHSYYNNSLYNSVNLVDLNKGYGIIAFNFNSYNNFPFYITLFGRDMESINFLEYKLKLNKPNIKLFKFYVDTNEIPLCHHLLMVERIYLNINYHSIDKNNIYSLQSIFGKDFKQLNINEPDNKWKSLINVVAPNLNYLIPPNYFLISQISNTVYYIIAIIIIFIILLLFIVYHIKSKKENHMTLE